MGFRYSAHSLRGDFLRGGAGLALTALPALFLTVHRVIWVLLVVAALLFAFFVVRTVLRQLTSVILEEDRLTIAGPLGRTLPWRDLARVRLRYYSTRRDREGGWMHLILKGGGVTLRLESTLDGFQAVAERTAQAADDNGLELDKTTENNLAALGLLDRPGELSRRWGLDAGDEKSDGVNAAG